MEKTEQEIEQRLARPRPEKELRRLVRERVSRSVNVLREAEDVARLELRDDLLADRLREQHERITERVLNGKRGEPETHNAQ